MSATPVYDLDFAPIKEAHVRSVAIENAVFLAEDMGLRLRRVLS